MQKKRRLESSGRPKPPKEVLRNKAKLAAWDAYWLAFESEWDAAMEQERRNQRERPGDYAPPDRRHPLY